VAIARGSHDHGEKGGRLAALFPNSKMLALEAAVIAALIALTAFLVYHFTVHTIVNRRPLGAANVDVVPETFDQSQSAFAIEPANPKSLFGASNDTGLEVLRTYQSSDAGRTWTDTNGPRVAGGSCAHGAPAVAADGSGRQYLAFLASHYCGDSLTPYLVVTSRAGPHDRWSPLVRVAPQTWKYGFDDAPSLAVDPHDGALYLAWTRGISKAEAPVVVSSSRDRGRTWSAPRPISDTFGHAHRVRLAVAANGDLYAAGIDAKTGLWIVRSRDGGRSFSAPRAAAPLVANPSDGCAQTAGDPLPKELSACEGPDPTLSVGGDRVFVVYGDVGPNQTPDVFAAALTLDLKPLFHVRVNPVETTKTQQFMPTSALDAATGTLWACWYDTTYDPHAHRAWFTCSASRDGRRWSAPVRASSEPTAPDILYGTLGGSGLYPAIAARSGVAHVFWTDGRVIANSTDIFTAAIPQSVALTQRG
jgi:hypothetical protein